MCEAIYAADRQDAFDESFREVIHQFGESWKMEECKNKYGEDKRNDLDRYE